MVFLLTRIELPFSFAESADSMSLVFLWSDLCILFLVVLGLIWLFHIRKDELWSKAFRGIARKKAPMIAFFILSLYTSMAVLDSLRFEIHFKDQINEVESILDTLFSHVKDNTEKTYSAPFSLYLYTKETILKENGTTVQKYPRLKHAGQNLSSVQEKNSDLFKRSLTALFFFFIMVAFGIGIFFLFLFALRKVQNWRDIMSSVWSRFSWLIICFSLLFLLLCFVSQFYKEYHIFGTDKAGFDVFYISVKSIRTSVIIGSLTTLIVTPIAVTTGILAGYLGGWVDDLIQYIYSTLESIPDILLITAAMLFAETFIVSESSLKNADRKLVYLCIILGITSWTNLCRLIRAETLKVRELEYIEAAKSFGVSKIKIMLRHVLPNVAHIVFIVIVLRFSGLVLAEAVLSYIGIGVDPTIQSWGNMINQARFELAREPVIWWSLASSFIFMFVLVLSANVLADAVRDALDPKLNK